MGDSQGGAVPLSVEEAIRERKSAERLMMARNLDLTADSGHSAERIMAREMDLATDSNFNYDLKEMPSWNPNLPKEAQVLGGLPEGYGVNPGIPDATANLPQMMPELYISDPAMRKPSGSDIGPARAAAGISSNARHYKMASDIFGTGMDRSWSDAPPSQQQRPVQPFNSMSMPSQMPPRDRLRPGDASTAFKYPEQPPQNRGEQSSFRDSNGTFKYPEQPPQSALIRNRNEPSSFKITEDPSEAGSNDHPDFGIGSPSARKARESAGNPVTGEGYNDDSTKTAKRYYSGSNTNQKLW